MYLHPKVPMWTKYSSGSGNSKEITHGGVSGNSGCAAWTLLERLRQFNAGMENAECLVFWARKHCIVNNNNLAVLTLGFLPSLCAVFPDSKSIKWPLARTLPRVRFFFFSQSFKLQRWGNSINPMPGTSCALNRILWGLGVIVG